MSSGSVRLYSPLDKHQHEDPPEPSDGPAIPDNKCEIAGGDATCPSGGRLWREDGKLLYRESEAAEAQPARLVWARPLSDRGGPVSVLLAGKKKELAYLPSLDLLDAESRRIACEELAGGLVLPRITAIREVKPRFGNYYWDVETDMGKRRFLMTAPENNTMRPKPDVIVVRDVSGNCYEINPVSGLDRASAREMDRVL